ncbi:MAG TPA: SDR family NAD(P)-dependent oxidoreductase [Candidatus Binatia bacterium]|jgi:NAD(P)-dependent dehydrogenase (short-subunit alcohol dehydrogenase family)
MVSQTPKIAVVNGGAGGIGRAVVARLARAGFFPVIFDVNENAGRAALDELGGAAEFLRLELTDKAAVVEAFAKIRTRHKNIDLLVNLAGGTLHAHPIQEFPLAEWLRVVDVNLTATFLCCQAALPSMKRRRRGVIINTASNFAVTGSATRTAYAATKSAVIAFTKSLALEAAPFGVRAHAVAPGLTATERVRKHYSDESWAAQGAAIAMGRAAEPADIAEGVAFLASESAAFMSGQTLHVNGGMIMP